MWADDRMVNRGALIWRLLIVVMIVVIIVSIKKLFVVFSGLNFASIALLPKRKIKVVTL